MVYGIGQSREDGQRLIDKYQDKHMIDRAFELAWTHSQVMWTNQRYSRERVAILQIGRFYYLC